MIEGVKDAFRHWWIVLRCSVIGCIVGFMPGLGGSVVDWIAYGHVVQTSKNRETFGTGDVRGTLSLGTGTLTNTTGDQLQVGGREARGSVAGQQRAGADGVRRGAAEARRVVAGRAADQVGAEAGGDEESRRQRPAHDQSWTWWN